MMRTKWRGPLLWLVVFVGGAIFQLWRGSSVDTLVYSTVAVLVTVTAYGKFDTSKLIVIKFKTVTSILVFSAIVFLVLPIHSWLSAIFYLFLVPILLWISWQRDSRGLQDSDVALKKSSISWFVIGSLTCICELGNYFASDITHNDKAFPTLTVLLDPIVADKVGKVIFVAVWAAIGAGLFRVSTDK